MLNASATCLHRYHSSVGLAPRLAVDTLTPYRRFTLYEYASNVKKEVKANQWVKDDEWKGKVLLSCDIICSRILSAYTYIRFTLSHICSVYTVVNPYIALFCCICTIYFHQNNLFAAVDYADSVF